MKKGNIYYTKEDYYGWILNNVQQNEEIVDLRIENVSFLRRCEIDKNNCLLYLGTKQYKKIFGHQILMII